VAIQNRARLSDQPARHGLFFPALARTDGRSIPNADSTQQLGWKSMAALVRGTGPRRNLVPGFDNLERHFLYVQQWLSRETGR